MIDMRGFAEIIDAMGGVRVTVDEPIVYGRYREGLLPAGTRGSTARKPSGTGRSRTDSDDYVRMGRQKCLLNAVAKQADPVTVVNSFENLATATKRAISTDIPQSLLPALVELSQKVKDTHIRSLSSSAADRHGRPGLAADQAEGLPGARGTPHPHRRDRPPPTPTPSVRWPWTPPAASSSMRPSRDGYPRMSSTRPSRRGCPRSTRPPAGRGRRPRPTRRRREHPSYRFPGPSLVVERHGANVRGPGIPGNSRQPTLERASDSAERPSTRSVLPEPE